MDMRRDAVSHFWEPNVIGREKLDERRWAYAIEAPFEMAWDAPDLMGTAALLDDTLFDICGIVPNITYSPVKAGEMIELLVRRRVSEGA
jgi:hypothetical protein